MDTQCEIELSKAITQASAASQYQIGIACGISSQDLDEGTITGILEHLGIRLTEWIGRGVYMAEGKILDALWECDGGQISTLYMDIELNTP